MEEQIKHEGVVTEENTPITADKKGSVNQIAGAIIIAGIIIAGAILLKGGGGSATVTTGGATVGDITSITLPPVSSSDRTLGDPNAKLAFITYEDFQCPFCGRFEKEVEKPLKDTYVKNGEVQYIYRDYPFLGAESTRASEAARCAADQGKFWEYHDYLFAHQNGENQGAFSDKNLKVFAKTLGLSATTFNSCLDSGAHTKDIADSVAAGAAAGVSGTPKAFIVTKKDISSKTQKDIVAAVNVPGGVSFYTTKNIVSINGALSKDSIDKLIAILLKQ
jgi:protein-disulfide isomerase